MKKIYPIFILALAAGVYPQVSNAQITSVDQLYGNYNAVYTWGITDQNGAPDGEPTFLINPVIEAGKSEDQILIKNLFPSEGQDFPQNSSNPIEATVDLKAQTVTIASGQNLGRDSYGTNTLDIHSYDADTGRVTKVSSATAYINQYGNLCFPTQYIISCASSAAGYWYVYYTLTLQPYDGKYQHDSSFYNGTYLASFDWFIDGTNETIKDEVKPQIAADGEYKVEITHLYDYLNKNIDIEAEVLPSGDLKINNYQIWEMPNIGYQLIIMEEGYQMPDYVIAYLDKEGKLVFPKGTMVGMGCFPGYGNLATLYGYENLVLSNEAGVESIGADLSEGKVRYYNLSGQEILNPEKGQLIIKKVGNKASKIIVR